MNKLLIGVLASLAATGCASMGDATKTLGIVVQLGIADEAKPKADLQGISDRGALLFGAALVRPPAHGGSNSYPPGFGIPKTAHVTWRDDKLINVNEPGQKPGWMRGEIVGDYTIPVLNRIPKEVLDYALAGEGRALRLIFRIKDDGVLLAWDVQEAVTHPSGGGGWVYSMHGGDVPCEIVNPARPRCTEGPLERAPWFNPVWTRGK